MDKKKIFWIVGIILAAIIILVIGFFILGRLICEPQLESPPGMNPDPNIKLLYNQNYTSGIYCIGEGSREIKLGAGGRRGVICRIIVNETSNYELKVTNISSLKGASTVNVQSWVLDKDWKGTVNPGGDGIYANVLLLNIPMDAPITTLKLTIEEIKNNDNSTIKKHTSYVSIIPLNSGDYLKDKICYIQPSWIHLG